MDWKYEAMDKLREYEARRSALERIPEELKRLESEFTGIRCSVTDATPVSGGGSVREDRMLNNITRREELRRALKQARLWVKSADAGLDALDEEERLVLDRMYIHRAKGNVDRLCEELGVEQAAVYRRRDKALRHFTLALYGVVEN